MYVIEKRRNSTLVDMPGGEEVTPTHQELPGVTDGRQVTLVGRRHVDTPPGIASHRTGSVRKRETIFGVCLANVSLNYQRRNK